MSDYDYGRANGMSYSKLIYKNSSTNEIDNVKSRRVEFKVLAKEYNNEPSY